MDDLTSKKKVIDVIDDRIRALRKHPEFRKKNADIDLYGIVPAIMNLPSVDAVPVIRCGVCLKKRICLLYREANDENGFCAWGAREEK